MPAEILSLLASENAVPTALITSNVGWLPSSPLDAAKGLPLADAAVSERVGTAASPVHIDWTWDRPVDVIYAGLFKTNLRQSARWRVEAFGRGDVLLYSTVRADGSDRAVVGGMTDPRLLRWGASNGFRGDWPDSIFFRYPTNVHCVLPLSRVMRLRWTLYGPAYRPDRTADTGYRLGLGWAGDGLLFERHAGDADGYQPGDMVTKPEGGGRWAEPGVGARTASIDRSVVDKDERDAQYDLSVLINNSKPVVWLPNVNSQYDNMRYGGIFCRDNKHGHRHVTSMLASVDSIDLIEVTQ